jgi:hypothetical protein
MTNTEKCNELLYCINTLWHEYIITSKQYDVLRAEIEKEYGKDD